MPLSEERVAVVPWTGSRARRTLALRIRQEQVAAVVSSNFYLTLTAPSGGSKAIVKGLEMLAQAPWDEEEMARGLNRAECIQAKYDVYLPDELLRKSFAAACLDTSAATTALRELVAPDAAARS